MSRSLSGSVLGVVFKVRVAVRVMASTLLHCASAAVLKHPFLTKEHEQGQPGQPEWLQG